MSMHETVMTLRRVSLEPGRNYNVVVVSFDPSDTPAIAAEKKAYYAKEFGKLGFNDGWHFLTGSPTEIERTVVKGFKIAMAKVPAAQAAPQTDDELRAEAIDILHGDRFVLVDSDARIRGYYVADDAGIAVVLRDARALASP